MAEENLKSRIASGMIWKFSERILAQGISFIVSLVLARILVPDDYGVVAIVSVFIVIADIIISSGFSAALIQKKDVTDADYSTVFYINIILAFILYCILFFTAPLISDLYEMPALTWLLRVIALKLPISAYNSTQSAYVSRNMKFKVFFFSTLIGTLISAVVGIVLAYKGVGAWALVVQQLTNLVIDTLVLSVTVRWHPKLIFSKESIKSMFGFSSKAMATDLTGQAFNQVNSFIIGLRYTSADLAYYTKGQQLPSVINTTISSALSSVLFPAISKVHGQNGDIKQISKRSMKMIVFLLMPLMLGLAVISEDVIICLYTDKWVQMMPYMQIWCVEGAISTIGFIDILVLKSVGKSGVTLKLELIKKPLFLAIIFVAMYYGVFAIALTVPIAALLATIINSFSLKKIINYGFWEKLFDCSYSIIASLITGAIVWAVGLIPINSSAIMLLLRVSIGIIVYILIAILTKNNCFKEILNYIKGLRNNMKKHNEITQVQNKQYIFLCNTVYQIISASCIVKSLDDGCCVDIILSDHTVAMKKIANRMKSKGELFRNVYYLETQNMYNASSIFDQTKKRKKKMQELDKILSTNKYDFYFCANPDPFAICLLDYCKKKNRKITLSWFEDGLGTYSYEKETFNKKLNFKSIIRNLILKTNNVNKLLKDFYVFNPEKLAWKPNATIHKIPTIGEDDEYFKEYLNEIFDYKNMSDGYHKKVVFFEDGYKDFNDSLNIKILKDIAEIVGIDEIIIKRHPRNPNEQYSKEGFNVNKNIEIPWEIIVLNTDFTNTVFVTFFSQCVIIPSIIMGKEIRSVILARISDAKEDSLGYFNYLNEYFYSENPDIYLVPEDLNEAKQIINKLKFDNNIE